MHLLKERVVPMIGFIQKGVSVKAKAMNEVDTERRCGRGIGVKEKVEEKVQLFTLNLL